MRVFVRVAAKLGCSFSKKIVTLINNKCLFMENIKCDDIGSVSV